MKTRPPIDSLRRGRARRALGCLLWAAMLPYTVMAADAPAAAPTPPVQSAAKIDDFAPFADAALEARYRGLIAKLRCLVCQNESLADSHAPLATDLRREVRGMLESGQADAAILAFLSERYGAFVLYDPPLDAHTVLLWAGPPLLLLLGAGWLVSGLTHRSHTVTPPTPLDASARAAVKRALAEEN